MSKINWLKELKWNDEHLEELRFAGFAYIRQGKYDIALTFFEALTILNPENGYDQQTCGAIYLEIGQPEKALKFLDKALQLETEDHAITLLNMAKAFFLLGKKEEGLKLAEILQREENPSIASVAKALLLAHS